MGNKCFCCMREVEENEIVCNKRGCRNALADFNMFERRLKEPITENNETTEGKNGESITESQATII